MFKARISCLAHYGRASHGLGPVAYVTAAALLTWPGQPLADTVIGHVLELHGDWELYPGGADSSEMHKLAKSQAIPAGAAIRIKAPSRDDFIIITGVDLKILIERRCQEIGTCYSRILLPDKSRAQDADGIASILLDTWTRLWNEAYQPSLHRMRGAGAPMMTDGVVALADRSIDLGEIMRYARAGRYALTRPGTAVNAQDARAQQLVFAWDPTAATSVPVGDMSPGLFDINEARAAATTAPPSKDPAARILVCDSATYPGAVSSFRKARDLTESWTGSADADTTRAFLRSFLASLEESIKVGAPPKAR